METLTKGIGVEGGEVDVIHDVHALTNLPVRLLLI